MRQISLNRWHWWSVEDWKKKENLSVKEEQDIWLQMSSYVEVLFLSVYLYAAQLNRSANIHHKSDWEIMSQPISTYVLMKSKRKMIS